MERNADHMNGNKGAVIRKTVTIVLTVLIILLIGFLFVLSMVFKNTDVTPSLFGYSLYLNQTSGIQGADVDALVIAKNITITADSEGKVILCERLGPQLNGGSTAGIFRLISVNADTNSLYYTVGFDTREGEYQISPGQVVGEADFVMPTLGKIIQFSLTQKGIILIAGVPVAIFIVLQILFAVFGRKEDEDSLSFYTEEEDDARQESPIAKAAPVNTQAAPFTLEDFLAGGGVSAKAISGEEISSIQQQQQQQKQQAVRFIHEPEDSTSQEPARYAAADLPETAAGNPVKSVKPAKPPRENSLPGISAEEKPTVPVKGTAPKTMLVPDDVMEMLRSLDADTSGLQSFHREPAVKQPIQKPEEPVTEQPKSAPILVVGDQGEKPKTFDTAPNPNAGVPTDSFTGGRKIAAVANSANDAFSELKKLMELDESRLRKKVIEEEQSGRKS